MNWKELDIGLFNLDQVTHITTETIEPHKIYIIRVNFIGGSHADYYFKDSDARYRSYDFLCHVLDNGKPTPEKEFTQFIPN